MNLRRRIAIMRIAVWFISIRSRTFRLAAQLFVLLGKLHIALAGKLARWKTHRRVEVLKKKADSLLAQNDLFRAECQTFAKAATNNHEIHRQRLLAAPQPCA